MPREVPIKDGFKLFIRIPEDKYGDDTKVTLVIPKSMAGKALEINVIPDEIVPFHACVIKDTDYKAKKQVDYAGYDSDWDVVDNSYEVVESHPECRDIECPECYGGDRRCENAFCSVCMGQTPCTTMTVEKKLSRIIYMGED